MKRDNDLQVAKIAVTPQTTSGALVPVAVDATSFSRARFIFSFGANDSTIAALSTNLGVWAASTSGGVYSLITGAKLAGVSSGILGGNVMVVDTAVPTASPWLKASGAMTSTNIIVSAIVELYRGVGLPPTHTEQQIVAIG